MPSDTTYLYFQRGRAYNTDPYYASKGWGNSQRSSSVPRSGLIRHASRAHSLPPQTFNQAASVIGGGAKALGGGATVHRCSSVSLHGPTVYEYRAGEHSLTPALLYTRSPKGSFVPVNSYTGVSLPPVHSYSPSKRGIIINAPQRFSPSPSAKSLAIYRPTAFYKAPPNAHAVSRSYTLGRVNSSTRGRAEGSTTGRAQGARHWSAWRGTSGNREPVDNGHAKIKIVESKDKVNNGPSNGPRWTSHYEVKADPSVSSEKALLADLKSRASVARTQLNRHRDLLDRYLPISMDKPKDVDDEIANKYGELLIRMPQLEYKHRSTKHKLDDETPARLIIPPYTPAFTTHYKVDKLAGLDLPPVKNSFTQKMSEPRKHARRVLCMIKGDPKYFDYS